MSESVQSPSPLLRRWLGRLTLGVLGLALGVGWWIWKYGGPLGRGRERPEDRFPLRLLVDRYVLSPGPADRRPLHVRGYARVRRWNLQVLDAQGQPVVELAAGGGDTPLEAVWKGQDADGKEVPEGLYLIRLAGWDRWGRELPPCEQRLVVDRRPPQVVWHQPRDGSRVSNVFEVQLEIREANLSKVQLDYRAGKGDPSWRPVPEAPERRQENFAGGWRYTSRVTAAQLDLKGQDRLQMRATVLDQAGHRTALVRSFRLTSGSVLAVGFAAGTGQRIQDGQRRVVIWWTAAAGRPVIELRLFAVDSQTHRQRLLATYRPGGEKTTGRFETVVPALNPPDCWLAVACDRTGQFAQATWSAF